MTSTYLNASTKGVKGAFKKLEAKRRRANLKVVGDDSMAREIEDGAAISRAICNTCQNMPGWRNWQTHRT